MLRLDNLLITVAACQVTSVIVVHLRGLSLLTNEDGLRAQLGALQTAHRHATADYGIPSFKWDINEVWDALRAQHIDLPSPTHDYSFLVQLINQEGAPLMVRVSGDGERGNHPPSWRYTRLHH